MAQLQLPLDFVGDLIAYLRIQRNRILLSGSPLQILVATAAPAQRLVQGPAIRKPCGAASAAARGPASPPGSGHIRPRAGRAGRARRRHGAGRQVAAPASESSHSGRAFKFGVGAWSSRTRGREAPRAVGSDPAYPGQQTTEWFVGVPLLRFVGVPLRVSGPVLGPAAQRVRSASRTPAPTHRRQPALSGRPDGRRQRPAADQLRGVTRMRGGSRHVKVSPGASLLAVSASDRAAEPASGPASTTFFLFECHGSTRADLTRT